jgi:hypothetical protein
MNRSVIDHLKFSRCFHCGEQRGHKVFYTSAGVTFICRICKTYVRLRGDAGADSYKPKRDAKSTLTKVCQY